MAAISAACSSERSPANASRDLAGSMKNSVAVPPSAVGYCRGTSALFSTLSFEPASTSPEALALVRRERRDEDEADDVLGSVPRHW